MERETGFELLGAFGSSPSAWESDGDRETALVFTSRVEIGVFEGRLSKSREARITTRAVASWRMERPYLSRFASAAGRTAKLPRDVRLTFCRPA
jgi:hypothetical protein